MAGSSGARKFDLVVMDWGIGGLSVYNEIVKRLPGLSILYYSDSGQTPYGKMKARELRERIRDLVLSFRDEFGVKHFVIACNAASTALPALISRFEREDVHVTGVIERGIDIVRASRYRNVGVIGGARTIRSRSYTSPLNSSRRTVIGRVAQPLSALIERGDLRGEVMTSTLRSILSPLRGCDALVLACTHYPAVSAQIGELLPDCALLDPAVATADYVATKWKWPAVAKRGDRSEDMFMTSGDPAQMKRAALAAFGNKLPRVRRRGL